MIATPIRADIDGQWFETGTPPHYAKQLSASRAWQVFEPQQLRGAPFSLVRDVEVRLSDDELMIHYAPGLELPDLGTLRDLLHLTGPLVVWRTAVAALDLCQCLRELHEADVPQMVIHPERIGKLQDRLVIVPTLPGVLPPLSEALANSAAGWLHYIAPEVLRTRALERDLLFAADLYSLGRTLEALCMSDAEALDSQDSFELATRQVESLQPNRLGNLSPKLARLRVLIARMCARLPEQRPTIQEVIKELETVIQENRPEQLLAQLAPHSLIEAESMLADFRYTLELGLFHLSERALHIMTADVAMMRQPADCGLALKKLEAAEDPDHYEFDIQVRLGRVYAGFTNYREHFRHSAEAYQLAARLSGWSREVLEEWLPVLTQLFDDPEHVLELTDVVPEDHRTMHLVELRVNCLIQVKEVLFAWTEITPCLLAGTVQQAVIKLAQAVAELNDPLDLVVWMYKVGAPKNNYLGQAIAWTVNGNTEEAMKCFDLARKHQQIKG